MSSDIAISANFTEKVFSIFDIYIQFFGLIIICLFLKIKYDINKLSKRNSDSIGDIYNELYNYKNSVNKQIKYIIDDTFKLKTIQSRIENQTKQLQSNIDELISLQNTDDERLLDLVNEQNKKLSDYKKSLESELKKEIIDKRDELKSEIYRMREKFYYDLNETKENTKNEVKNEIKEEANKKEEDLWDMIVNDKDICDKAFEKKYHGGSMWLDHNIQICDVLYFEKYPEKTLKNKKLEDIITKLSQINENNYPWKNKDITSVYRVLEKYLNQITNDQWNWMCRNSGKSHVNFVEKHLDKLNEDNWSALSSNIHALHILEKYPEKINVYELLRTNNNPTAFNLVKKLLL